MTKSNRFDQALKAYMKPFPESVTKFEVRSFRDGWRAAINAVFEEEHGDVVAMEDIWPLLEESAEDELRPVYPS